MFVFDLKTVMAANSVIAKRMPMIFGGLMTQNAGNQRELERMVTEKITATTQGAALAPAALLIAAGVMSRNCGRGVPPGLAMMSACHSVLKSMSAPANRCVHNNARRLARVT